jgi:hypothetical protein
VSERWFRRHQITDQAGVRLGPADTPTTIGFEKAPRRESAMAKKARKKKARKKSGANHGKRPNS